MPNVQDVKILFHGGEPMLAPVSDMMDVVVNTRDLWKNVEYSITTNLAYEMTDERMEFLKIVGEKGMASSFDDMRFQVGDQAHRRWSQNSKLLSRNGIMMTMMVSLSKTLIRNYTPSDLYDIAEENGYQYILFERITPDGNASLYNPSPTNNEQDDWMYSLFKYRLSHQRNVGDMLLSEVAQAYVGSAHVGNRCRNCESTLMTINADGSISGCPNTAPSLHWGTIDEDVNALFQSKNRLKAITCESERNPVCYDCEAFSICNGDCHQLKWEGEYCAAPKKIWQHMMREKDVSTYRNLILD